MTLEQRARADTASLRRVSGVPLANRVTGAAVPTAAAGNRHPGAEIPTYYDQPALKASFYGWKVSTYMFVAGVAGSAQVIATAAGWAGGERYRTIVRNGRYIALAGATIGAPLLIADLHTPRRFYNMLRIFRPTSPMSIGTYVLVGFGGCSALLAALQLRQDIGTPSSSVAVASRVTEVPAAILGAAMSVYTGALLGATSTPLWAAAPRLIPALFGASAMASAAATLALASGRTAAAPLQRLETAASAIELYLLDRLGRRLRDAGITTPLPTVPLQLAAAAPLLHEAALLNERFGRNPSSQARSQGLGAGIAVAVLAGAFLLRHLVLQAGNRSAQRPRDYFRFADGQ